MRNRDYKNFAPGTIWHVYNRGNNKDKIFFDDQDYKAFLFRLCLVLGSDMKDINTEKLTSLPYSRIRITNSKKGDFAVHAFCLMPNHLHILIEQNNEIPISKMMSKLCTSYSMYINKKHRRVGHLFQDQFKAVRISSNEQLLWILEYIHQNPVKDKLVNTPEKYKWSSYSYFKNNKNLFFLSKKYSKLIT